MKIAIMQPYFFPYIGYFQLVNVVDKFVFYDDVNFIKQGWIARNRLFLDNEVKFFSIPLKDLSSFRKINETCIDQVKFNKWKEKFYKSLYQNYHKAPFFDNIFPIVQQVLENKKEYISDIAKDSIVKICSLLKIKTSFVQSSSIYNNNELKGEQRVIDICVQEKANEYFNLSGGKSLYDKNSFRLKNISLNFIENKEDNYTRFNQPFQINLSIIDLLMFTDLSQPNQILNNFKLY